MKYNAEFLKALDNDKNKTIYAKIISLQFNELPVETIEGKVVSGSINIDGTSAVRRSCSLSLIPDNIDIHEYYWSKGIKFKLEIGVSNNIDINYPNIIWFPQGVYVINSFSTSLSTNNYTINIQGKDKMCLLNGDLGGTVNSSIDFGTIETQIDKKTSIKEHYPIKDIIREAIHQYGGEYFHNIIINDIDDLGLELQEYRYSEPLYIFRDSQDSAEGDMYYNMTLNGNMPCWFTYTVNDILIAVEHNGTLSKKYYNKLFEYDNSIANYFTPVTTELYELSGSISELRNDILNPYLDEEHDSEDSTISDDIIIADSLTLSFTDTVFNPTRFSLSEGEEPNLCMAKINFGDTAGYTTTQLTYPGDLILSAGESLTKLLDLIVAMLGEFEYFYDLDGRFIFQRKQTYLSNQYSPLQTTNEGTYSENAVFTSKYSYIFNNSELFTSISNNPSLNNIKNDFTVWGTNSSDKPICMRYAIDKKPFYYKTITVTQEEIQRYNEAYSLQQQPQTGIEYFSTEYKHLVTDEENQRVVDWRELIYQMATDYKKYNHLDNFELKIIEANQNQSLYLTGKTGYEQYYIDMEGKWRYLYNPDLFLGLSSGILAVDELADFSLGDPDPEKEIPFTENPKNYFQKNTDLQYWAKNVYLNPGVLEFWIDFLDENGELSKFSNQAIGNRPNVKNESHVKSVFYKATPSIIFTTFDKFQNEARKDGYKYFLASNLDDMFTQSSQGRSAKEVIDELLYKHSYCADNINLNTIPIYYLEPNTRIRIYNEETNIDGDYIISKITISLGAGKTMSITASKAPTRLL